MVTTAGLPRMCRMSPGSTGLLWRKAQREPGTTPSPKRVCALKDIATAIGRGLNVPVISISQEQAQEHFGFLGFFAGRDPLTSSAQTRAKLGWNPTGPSLLTDLGNMRYSEV